MAILIVLVAVSCYVMLFYLPMTEKRATLENQIGTIQGTIQEDQIKLARKEQMERELTQLFSSGAAPASIAPYDNIQALMVELNGILGQTREYALNFSTVDTEEAIVRRYISLSYTTDTYSAAKSVLQSLHDSTYRCMLDGLDLTFDDNGVKVDATLVFFEYQAS
jgi:hypothetical protein